jgi:cytoskeletal protein RodZ
MSSFGDEFRRERELREISLREVAEATKISLRHLEALEQNSFESLPGGVFNRGFVRAYAEFIGIDPEAMVNAYLMEQQTQSTGKQHDDHLLRRPPTAAHETPANTGVAARQWLRWGLWILVVAVVAAGVYLAVRFALDARDASGNDVAVASVDTETTTGTTDRGSTEDE